MLFKFIAISDCRNCNMLQNTFICIIQHLNIGGLNSQAWFEHLNMWYFCNVESNYWLFHSQILSWSAEQTMQQKSELQLIQSSSTQD